VVPVAQVTMVLAQAPGVPKRLRPTSTTKLKVKTDFFITPSSLRPLKN